MIKTAQENYFDKTGKKVFTYFYIDDPYFYDDDANSSDNWVKAYIPLKSNESAKKTFYRMLLSHEILTAHQLREYQRKQVREQRKSFKSVNSSRRVLRRLPDIALQRRFMLRERQ